MHPDDLIIWPCGTSCFACELPEFGFMSDDYERVSVDDPSYAERCAAL